MTPLTPPEESTDSCYSCQALRGERHISPAEHIYDGRYWIVDHAWPTALVGWVVLVLRQVHGYSHDEIGTMLGISAGTSRVRLTRALESLRRSLR